jgi:hypothetical protein
VEGTDTKRHHESFLVTTGGSTLTATDLRKEVNCMARIIGDSGTTRRRWSFLGALFAAVLVSGILVPGAFAASTSPSVVDYAQCANGAHNATPANDPTTCNQGWINGILNASNSQYREDQVTAQRLVVNIPHGNKTTDHTITLRYLWNKSQNHAYDSLAKWNTTITGVTTPSAACAGVPGTCPATSSNWNSGDGDSQFGVPSSTCSAGHELGNRDIVSFNGTITGIDAPVNDSSTCSLTADEYETVVVHYTTNAGNSVMFLFGGHLAAGLTAAEGSPRGWGDNHGAAGISGGPYHIKLDALDGASAGNRDNQIMSNAVLPLIVATGSTSPSATVTTTVTWTADLTDTLTLSSNTATGTADFYLYDTALNCAGGSTTVGTGGLLYHIAVPVVAGTTTAAATQPDFSPSTLPTSATTYYWLVNYGGDGTHAPVPGTCGDETETITPPSVTNATASP